MNGVTLDTGALIGLERRTERMKAVIARIAARQLPVTIPSVVVAEWYREQRDAKRILALAKLVEPVTGTLAELAGALAREASRCGLRALPGLRGPVSRGFQRQVHMRRVRHVTRNAHVESLIRQKSDPARPPRAHAAGAAS